ncbi:MAG: transcriptional repressor [Chloroflexi bacterium]|nr:transcriptional repressor [Chloroflexota bacterium]
MSEQQVRKRPVRLSSLRLRVLAVLEEANAPLTAAEVGQRAGTSTASTYRALGFLVQQHLVIAVPDGNLLPTGDERRVWRYARCVEKRHHHHFVCKACHSIIDIRCSDFERALAALTLNSEHLIESHELTLVGTCVHCLSGESHPQ